MIQYWNYLTEYKIEKKRILSSVDKVFKSGTLLLGKELKKFEKNYCKFNKSKYEKFTKNFLTSRTDKIPNYKVIVTEVFGIHL